MRIAMWSGPRNLSTAMMYSFGNRADFSAVDEPFYATYLAQTGLNHPMRDEVLESQPQDPALVIDALLGPIKTAHVYHKHMTQHMLPSIPRDWIANVTNVFLIRHPARVVASFSDKYDNPTLTDIGFVQQAELFNQVRALGQTPIVIDSADIRLNPRHMLSALCEAIGLPFDEAMLNWNAGPRSYDGVWAPHWYASVHGSTGFAGAEGPLPEVSENFSRLVTDALPYYHALYEHRLT